MTDANFHIETARLYISYFQPALDAHCDFLVRLYNTPEFIATCGRTAITTREIARERLVRFAAVHARNGYGIFLVSLKPSSAQSDAPAGEAFQDTLARCKLVGTVSLMRGDDAVAFTVPDLGFAVLPEEMRKGYAKEASAGLLEVSWPLYLLHGMYNILTTHRHRISLAHQNSCLRHFYNTLYQAHLQG